MSLFATNLICRKQKEADAAAEAKDMANRLAVHVEEEDVYQLPDGDEEEGVPDLPGILSRIKEVARVLDNFKQLRDINRPRSDYMDQVCSRVPTFGRSQTSRLALILP